MEEVSIASLFPLPFLPCPNRTSSVEEEERKGLKEGMRFTGMAGYEFNSSKLK